jgi:hypothetical protein
LTRADDEGFELRADYPAGCTPGGGGLGPTVEAYEWSSDRPARATNVSCAAPPGDTGFAVASSAWIGSDAAVLVPGTDAAGPFVVRVRAQ